MHLKDTRAVITPIFFGVGIGIVLTSNWLEFELLELDPRLEWAPVLEPALPLEWVPNPDLVPLMELTPL